MRALMLLLSLSTFYGAMSQTLNEIQVQFLKEKASPINLDDQLSNGNWDALGRAIEGKQIVSLGEFNHETPEVFQIKNDLIKYLHQEHGFNTILFEAGIGELIVPDQQKQDLSPQEMTYGFFSYWRVQELIDLMGYVQMEGLNVAGFDVQRFGRSFSDILSMVAANHKIDTSYYLSLERRFGEAQSQLTSRGTTYEDVKEITEILGADYKRLLSIWPPDNTDISGLIRQTLSNRIHYLKFRLQFLKDNDWNQRWLARDSMMAENVLWLIENYYPEEKIIIYAHNFHIAKHNEKEEVMGEYLKKDLQDRMYTIGFFAGKGSFGDKTLTDPDSQSLDIKHVIKQLGRGVNFLDISKMGNENRWVNEPIVINDTFIDLSNSNTLTLSKQFDGLILIDQVGVNK